MGRSKKSRKIREINVHGTRINPEFIPADIQFDIDEYCYQVPGSEDSVGTRTQNPKKKKIHEKPSKLARKVICKISVKFFVRKEPIIKKNMFSSPKKTMKVNKTVRLFGITKT